MRVDESRGKCSKLDAVALKELQQSDGPALLAPCGLPVNRRGDVV
jgi:hypothetical protein